MRSPTQNQQLRSRVGLILSGFIFLSPWRAIADFGDFEDSAKPPAKVTPAVTPAPTATPTANLDDSPTTDLPPKPTPRPTPLTIQSGGTKPNPATEEGNTNRGGGADFLSGRFLGNVEHDTSAPIGLAGDRVTGSRKDGQVHLIGNAEITQGNLRIQSTKITVYGDPVTNQFTRVIAVGKVRVQKGDPEIPTDLVRARAKEMEFQAQTGKMILRGDAHLSRGSSCEITGDTLEFELVGGEISALGGESIRGMCAPPPPAQNPTAPSKEKDAQP